MCVGFFAILIKYLADDCNLYRRFRRFYIAGILFFFLVVGGIFVLGRRGFVFGKFEVVWRVCRIVRFSVLF